MRTYITLDVDPGPKLEEGIHNCLKLFKEYNIHKVTWFVNNRELDLTGKREELLKKMEGEIALHVHLDREPFSTFYTLPNKEAMIHILREDKNSLEAWMKTHIGQDLNAFRSGDLLTNEDLFDVLNHLGFKIDSSLSSQFDWSLKEIARRVLCPMSENIKYAVGKKLVNKRVYRTLPLKARPFYIGKLLEAPIHVYVGGSNLAKKGWMEKRTELQASAVEDLVVYWHPHETEVYGIEKYSSYIEFLMDLRPEFRTIGEIC